MPSSDSPESESRIDLLPANLAGSVSSDRSKLNIDRGRLNLFCCYENQFKKMRGVKGGTAL